VFDPLPRLFVDERAAARGEHMRRIGQEPGDHLPLAAPKRGLPEALEDIVDGAACCGLDFDIGIAKGHPKRTGQPPADRRLSRPHHTDQNQGFIQLSHGWGLHLFCCEVPAGLARVIPIPPKRRLILDGSSRELGIPQMGWKLLLGFVLLLVLGAGALAFYGSRLEPPQRTIEETLPDNRFPK
jgi:hypothetical protein